MEDPIVLLGFPRTGSTLAAHIFRDHGVWIGECEKKGGRLPTGGGENVAIKNILKTYPGGIGERKIFKYGFKFKVEDILKNEGYVCGPWVMKHALVYWPVWNEFNPYFVIIQRDKDSILSSNNATSMAGVTGERLENLYKSHVTEMEIISILYNPPVIHMNEVVKGDYSSLEAAFEYCQLKFNPEIPDRLINKDYWHYGS